MKLGDKLFYGLLFVGVGLLIYNYKDKIFSKKEGKDNSSIGTEGIDTPPKLINTENLGMQSSSTINEATNLPQAIILKYGANYAPKIGDFVIVGSDRYEYMSKLDYSNYTKVSPPILGSPKWHKWRGDGSDPM